MPTMEEYLTRPLGDRVARLRSTPDEMARLLDGKDDRALSRRPDARSDGREALQAFQRRRHEVIGLLDALDPGQWQRSGIHLARGRMELGEWVASLAGHDDNHLGQLRRALDARP